MNYFFKSKDYTKCNVRYLPRYGAGYVWDINADFPINYEPKDDLSKQIVYKDSTNGASILNSTDKTYCLNVCFCKPKKSKKPNQNLIKDYLRYFTMNSSNVLDALALDYVNSILCWDFHHKNTLVLGDKDKLKKWLDLFCSLQMAGANLIMFYLHVNFDDCLFKNILQPYIIEECTDRPQKNLEESIERCSLGVNCCRSNHRYFLTTRNVEIKNKYKRLVNIVDFPYGGEFYEMEKLSDVDKVEVVKLLIVHGWHLLNSKVSVKPDLNTKNEDVFFNNLINTDEARIPLYIIHQIYLHFVNGSLSDTEIRKRAEANGFKYTTMKLRKSDIDYLQELSNKAKNCYLNIEIPQNNTQKCLSCKLDPKFWDEINPNTKKDNEYRQASEFDLYLKTLAEKYAKFYDVDIPEPESFDDPLKDFKKPEDISDDELQ